MPPTSTTTLTSSQEHRTLFHSEPRELKAINRKPSVTETKKDDQVNVMDATVPLQIVWRNVGLFVYLHLAALYGGYLFLTGHVKWQTFLLGTLYYFMSGLGITAGCHRYWAHKSYKAKLPLQLLLTLFQTVAFQNSIREWSRDHRVHHKYSETNADPHNAKRGFFFAHMGWLMCRKHPAVKEKGAGIDMSDLDSCPIVSFQNKYYLHLVFLFCFFLPTVIPMVFWGESFTAAWFFITQFRYCCILHWTWLVNSAAHMFGNRPYDKSINPSENKTVSILAMGEGWHNYHHTFPWDYKAAELGNYRFNITTMFIDGMAAIGWAYDLKTVPANMVRQRVTRTGDGSHEHFHHHDHVHEEGAPWGWGDKDIKPEDASVTQTIHRLNEGDLPGSTTL